MTQLAIPLQAEDELLGVVHMVHPEPNFFSEADYGVVEVLGMQAMIALRSHQFWRSLQEPLRALAKVASRLQRTDGDLSLLLRLVLTGVTASQGLGYTRAMVFRFDRSGEQMDGLAAVGPSDGEEARTDWSQFEASGKHEQDGQRMLDTLLDRAAQYERDVKAGKSRQALDWKVRKKIQTPPELMVLAREVANDPLQGVRRSNDPALRTLLSGLGLESGMHACAFTPLSLNPTAYRDSLLPTWLTKAERGNFKRETCATWPLSRRWPRSR